MLVFFNIIVLASGLERGIVPVALDSTKLKIQSDKSLYASSHALVIGVENYVKGWADLPGVGRDVSAVSRALKEHGFSITLVNDPTRDELEKALDDFIFKYGQIKNNRIVIYFAGHGHTHVNQFGREMGYLVPSNAPIPDDDIEEFFASAIDMRQIEVYARRLQSGHALFLFDSCFSGSIFSGLIDSSSLS